MVLLHLLRWLNSSQPQITCDVLTLNGGAIESEFKELSCDFYNYKEITKQKKLKLWQRFFLKIGWFKRTNHEVNLVSELSNNNYQIVYANTILSVQLAHELVSKNKNIRFIAHVHELNTVIKINMPNFDNYTSLIDQFIVPSQLVKKNLIKNRAIQEDKIDVVYECALTDIDNKKQVVLKEEKVFTIGASGTVDWRKGHDVFIQLARYLDSNYDISNFKFIWVGHIKLQDQIILEEDIEKLGLKEKVIFVGEQENPSNYFKDFDVFVMTSREDPFPLVCIEVGMLGKPIISFDKAVGTNEVLKNGGGFIVPYLNIEAMVEKIMEYYTNSVLLEAHGEINKTVFSQFTPELICPQLFSILQKHIK
tara:strand:+ start:1181 stop:2272 length:1092 start_codon:yes stop_codon:yes gene_type:complete